MSNALTLKEVTALSLACYAIKHVDSGLHPSTMAELEAAHLKLNIAIEALARGPAPTPPVSAKAKARATPKSRPRKPPTAGARGVPRPKGKRRSS